VISEGSCDTGVMMLKITGINYTLLYIHNENSDYFYYIFDQINSLGERKRLFQKHLKRTKILMFDW